MVTANELRGLALSAYDALHDPEQWPDVIAKLLDCLRAPFGGIPHGIPPLQIDVSLWRGKNPADSGISFEPGNNPAVGLAYRLPVGTYVRYEEAIRDAPEFLRFIHGYMEGLKHTAHLNLCTSGRFSAGLVVHRGTRIEDEEIKAVASIAPHLEGVFALKHQLQAKVNGLAGLSALEHLASGVIVVDEKARPTFVSPFAERILATEDGLRLDRGAVAVSAQTDVGGFGRALAAAIRTGDGHLAGGRAATVLPRPSGRAPLRVTVIPIRQVTIGPRSPRAAVLFDPSGRSCIPSAYALQTRHGLTLGESRVVARLVQGMPLNAIAEDMKVAITTVRSHLYRAFEKTGVKRQAELVALVSQGKASEAPVPLEE